MFKHANVYVPGAKVDIAPKSGEKLADDSQVKVATIVSVDPDNDTATVQHADGVVEVLPLDSILPRT